jgi:hypothetical protein
MNYEKNQIILKDRTVWIIEIGNNFNNSQTLLLSKMSEALTPNQINNHIGEGGTLDDFINVQPGVKFIINGSFNHYRKNFYSWKHQNFNIGDPVGLLKIRHHYYEDFIDLDDYGFFIQNEKQQPWIISQKNNLNLENKYILGSTPLLIFNGQKQSINFNKMIPVDKNTINPPSYLGHGLERHPRTAVGIKNDKIYFILVEFKNEGCSLPELQQLGCDLKLDSLLNLDGGGSSQFKLKINNHWISNDVEPKDKNRVLGNVIVLFDEKLK